MIMVTALTALPFVADPAPNALKSMDGSRNLECAYSTVEAGMIARPGQLSPPKPRGDYAERTVFLCAERFLPHDLRAPQDEAVLKTLTDTSANWASELRALHPDVLDRTLLVEAYVPDAQVGAKVSFAAKTALMAEGLVVSDRVPTLAAGDLRVIPQMHPSQAYPVACRRYHDNGSLGPNQALLGVLSPSRQTSELAAGICIDGEWSWLP